MRRAVAGASSCIDGVVSTRDTVGFVLRVPLDLPAYVRLQPSYVAVIALTAGVNTSLVTILSATLAVPVPANGSAANGSAGARVNASAQRGLWRSLTTGQSVDIAVSVTVPPGSNGPNIASLLNLGLNANLERHGLPRGAFIRTPGRRSRTLGARPPLP
jgi:hypothetical protein